MGSSVGQGRRDIDIEMFKGLYSSCLQAWHACSQEGQDWDYMLASKKVRIEIYMIAAEKARIEIDMLATKRGKIKIDMLAAQKV